MKWFHNGKVSLAWALIVEIAVHLLFAFQAFLLGGFLGDIALKVVFGPIGTQIGAWGFAIFVFMAAFQAFVLGEYLREHVDAFENTAKGNGSYKLSWSAVQWFVGAVEISSLMYRCLTVIQDGQYIQAFIIFILGVVLLLYAFAQAKIIHASVNRPVEQDMYQAQQYAGRSLVESSVKYVPGMTNEQKRRFVQGDTTAVDEVEQRTVSRKYEKLQSKEQKYELKKQREQERQRDYEKARQATDQLLNGPSKQQDPFLKALPKDRQANG
jgi:signal transduction histidine kinase